MYAAAYLSGRKESRKNIEVGIDHLSFGINSESAHAVVNARPETAGKESAFIGFGIVEDLRLEILQVVKRSLKAQKRSRHFS